MSSLKSDCGGNYSESGHGSYSFIHDRNLCKGNSSLDSVSNAKWWLDHHGLGRGYSHDQVNVLDADVKVLAAGDGDAKANGENQFIEDYCTTYSKNDSAFCSDMPLKHFYSDCKNKGDSWLQEFESAVSDDLLSNAHLMGLDSCNHLLSERPKKLSSEFDSHWIGLKRIEPWWHSVDKEDLVSLVSQTSYHHIRTCDYSGVQDMPVEKVSDNCANCLDKFVEQVTDKDTKVLPVPDCTPGNFASASIDQSLGEQGLMDYMLQESDETFSRDGSNTSKADSSETHEPSGNLSRVQLLEALCHSQTRAREAEKLAQEACDEKDNVFNLFFQQAACLFAYRQWLRILQLETLCLHLRTKDRFSSLTAPALLIPWANRGKGMTVRKKRRRGTKKKVGRHRCHLRKCAIAFAVGLGLAGAGLLVGWTVGWLFPAF